MIKAFISIILLTIPFSSWCLEEIILKDGVEISKKMEENEVFFRMCPDFDVDGKYLYMIELFQETVLKVDIETGKLVKAISSKGQGPGELMFAVNIEVKNGKVFVFDKGFGGIKIFTTAGLLFKEFKVRGILREKCLAVDDNNHIYLGRLDFTGKTMVSVYDLSGRRLRSVIKHDIDPYDRESIKRYEYMFDMDKSGNMYILFPVIRLIRKYDNKGKLTWEKEIKNRLLGKRPSPGTYLYKGRPETYLRRSISDFEIMNNYDIIIAHKKGGCILDKEGKLKKILIADTDLLTTSLRLIRVIGDKVINVCNYKRNVAILKLGG